MGLSNNANQGTPGRDLPPDINAQFDTFAINKFFAPFITLDQDGELEYYNFTVPGGFWDALVFTADYPIKWLSYTQYGETDAPFASERTTWPEPLGGSMFQDIDFVGTITPDRLDLWPGEPATGVTTTNGVRVSGFAGGGQFDDRGMEFQAAAVDPIAWLEVTCQNASPFGNFDYNGGLESSENNLTQGLDVILLESQYTQAIKDAGNILQVPNPFFGTDVLKVVGIFAETIF